ncbi:serine hydrolase domain-containing protein [Taibaiella koreensis]|uniref:serine hydrolase domain-containing protein n=1 Tax=Taibaiella koreensis TaxID=1268548 RepID=UPI000E59E513|nr:serine hydrolase domain-containing protein [Taibaiella koreensis]
MMMKKYCGALLFLAFAYGVQAQTIAHRMQHIVDSVYAQNPEAVGFIVHVESPGQKLSWSYATGYSNRKTKQKVSPDEPVLIASNTKPYVAATILRLEEQGKLQIDQPVGPLLKPGTNKTLMAAGYRTDSITLKHLLSHTSGIRDYVDEGYFKFIGTHKKHEWSRDEQIARAAGLGRPLSGPGQAFKYADINYVLLTEVIEHFTGKPFYTSIRTLLDYRQLQLDHTWFAKLEKAPKGIVPAAHQYWDEFGWDTYDLDPSWDLYGGGGMKATLKDMALFFQYLFNGKVIHSDKVLATMYTDVPPDLQINYCLGIRKIKYSGLMGYNHGGGLGTDVIFIPELNATIAVAALEAMHRPVALKISQEIIRALDEEKSSRP